jgi:hypothetical protein
MSVMSSVNFAVKVTKEVYGIWGEFCELALIFVVEFDF